MRQTEKRDFHSFTESCRQRKNTKRKVNEKGGIDSLEKKHTPKKEEKTQGWKNIRKTIKKKKKKRKRKSEEEISSEEEFFYFT